MVQIFELNVEDRNDRIITIGAVTTEPSGEIRAVSIFTGEIINWS